MSLISIMSLALAMLVLAASPGPGIFATVARSLASGFRPALAVIAGIVAGDIIYLMFAIFGLSIIAQKMEALFIIVRVCGGTYLFWLGLKMFFLESPEPQPKQLDIKHSRLENIFSGLLITLSNPKVMVFYCSFLPTFLDLSVLKMMDIAIVVCVIIIVLSSVLVAYAYLASHAKQILSSPKATKKLNQSAGRVMMATGVVIATKL